MNGSDENEDRVAARSRELFLDSAKSIDSIRSARLAAARREAVDAMEGQRPRYAAHWMPLAGVAVAASLVAVALLPSRPGDDAGLPLNGGIFDHPADIELLLESDGLEMIEDLEFYSWIESNADAAQQPAAVQDKEVDYES